MDAYPEIAEVGKEPDQTHNIGGGWHTNHRYDAVPAMVSMAVTEDVTHPLVITHPLSGKKALNVNPQFTIGIVGWSKADSDALLHERYPNCMVPEDTYQFK